MCSQWEHIKLIVYNPVHELITKTVTYLNFLTTENDMTSDTC